MVDIQSATAEIRRGKPRKKKKKQDEKIMSASATQGGHKEEDRNHRQKYNGLPYYIGRP